MIKNYNQFLNETIAYHGNKSGNIAPFIDDIGKPKVMYLTTNPAYALSYANNKKDGVFEYDIDTSNLLDLRKLGIKKYSFKDLQQAFYKLTKLYFPAELKNKFSWTGRVDDMSLWEWLRYDSSSENIIKNRFEGKYNGIYLQEEKDGISWESIMLFNNKPITSFIGILK